MDTSTAVSKQKLLHRFFSRSNILSRTANWVPRDDKANLFAPFPKNYHCPFNCCVYVLTTETTCFVYQSKYSVEFLFLQQKKNEIIATLRDYRWRQQQVLEYAFILYLYCDRKWLLNENEMLEQWTNTLLLSRLSVLTTSP